MPDNFHESMNMYRIGFLNANTKILLRKYIGSLITHMASYGIYLLKPFVPESFVRLDKPIFIIGCSRSGTTLFEKIFSLHGDIANWSEAGQILELRYFDYKVDHFKDEYIVTSFNDWRLRSFFGIYTRLKNKERFVNKNPDNSVRIRFLKRIFPDAIFIHLIRDGRAVVRSSYAKTTQDSFRQDAPLGFFVRPPDWKKYLELPLILQFSHQWTDVINHIRKTARAVLSEKDYLEILYEDFCRDPHSILRSIDIFCGLNPDKRLFSVIPSKFDSQNFKWNKDLSEDQVRGIQNIVGDLLLELGYTDPPG